MKIEVQLKLSHIIIVGLIMAAITGTAFTGVDKTTAWHSATQIRVAIDGEQFSLQEAIDNHRIHADHALTADDAASADTAQDTDAVGGLSFQEMISRCNNMATHSACRNGGCVKVPGSGADECQNDEQCGYICMRCTAEFVCEPVQEWAPCEGYTCENVEGADPDCDPAKFYWCFDCDGSQCKKMPHMEECTDTCDENDVNACVS